MYSVVMMMALTVNAEAPEFGRRGCCGGCCGGYSSCYGCCGGYGYGCCGGYSYGCCGGYSYGCGGCSGYSYGCCGGYSYGCSGCSGYSYGCCGGYSCGGCYGGCGGYVTGYSGAVTPGYVISTPAPAPAALVTQNGKTPARLVVTLPAQAKLTIDGDATTSTSATRTFVTPPLESGKSYTYTLKATVVVGDKTEVITKAVRVAAGEETRETLTLPEAVVSAGK